LVKVTAGITEASFGVTYEPAGRLTSIIRGALTRSTRPIEVAGAWLGSLQQVISEHRSRWEKMMTDDAAWPLAQHVCRTGYADLPVSAVESARRDILDTFGCMLGGSGSPGIDELFAVISRWGGLAEAASCCAGSACRRHRQRC
jgi:hypothetical protein